jgi:hypothetical protein
MLYSVMREFIINNKEWIFSGIGVLVISSFIAFILWIIRTVRQSKEKAEKRIEKFVDEFRKLYKNDGRKLEILIPAGINNLKNDKEIKLAFESLMKVVPNHPLRNWKTRVKKRGYQRFFRHVAHSGRILNKHSIETFLNELENQ